tara:strand:+ start:239 stop:361 length:123 start_codon:yes stop_codon:yes gene_type:complete
MAVKAFIHRKVKHKKRPGVHSKNASRSQNAYKKPYNKQGK